MAFEASKGEVRLHSSLEALVGHSGMLKMTEETSFRGYESRRCRASLLLHATKSISCDGQGVFLGQEKRLQDLGTRYRYRLPGSQPMSIIHSYSREVTMKKVITKIEDLWVAVAFAEAGIYEPVGMYDSQPICRDSVRIHTA